MAEYWDIYDKDRKKTGRLMQRGEPMADEDYHLVVMAWIRNSRGQWFLTKRSEHKSMPLLWEVPGGSVLAGEDSIHGVLREIREETGIAVEDGTLFRSFRRDKISWENPGFLDIWVFQKDFDLSDVRLQPEETCDCRWATAEEILQLMEDGTFMPMKEHPYHLELFDAYK
ncbi:MAG: NUDIX domain-containing protein [Oscillospiraceae bacterium]|nr:NUDIX domain-containing protein [Oscillospiraceae bacterium]